MSSTKWIALGVVVAFSFEVLIWQHPWDLYKPEHTTHAEYSWVMPQYPVSAAMASATASYSGLFGDGVQFTVKST